MKRNQRIWFNARTVVLSARVTDARKVSIYNISPNLTPQLILHFAPYSGFKNMYQEVAQTKILYDLRQVDDKLFP